MFSLPRGKYQRIEEVGIQEEQKIAENENEAGVQGRCPRSRIFYVVVLSLLTNVVLLLRLSMKIERMSVPPDHPVSAFAELAYDTPRILTYNNDYWVGNRTESDRLWYSIETASQVVLSQDEIMAWGLPPSDPFPWDQSKSLYIVQSQHLMHCLQHVYRVVRRSEQGDTGASASLDHVYHCLDSIRQYINCHADDTPLAADRVGHTVGEHQILQCRDMSRLLSWAREGGRNSCYRDVDLEVGPKNSIDWFSFCPEDSPYYATMKEYFRTHESSLDV